MENPGACIQQGEMHDLFADQDPTEQIQKREDLLRRFAATPYGVDLDLMGRIVRLESNQQAVLDQATKFFRRYQQGRSHQPEFVWRLLCDPDPKVGSTAVPFSAFSDVNLRYVNIGQRGFLAVDFERREGVGFLPEIFFEGEARLRHRPPLDILFCMTAASLGLVSLSGGCVGANGRGAMVFGPPNSGKTTACYLAARSGMEFQADQVVFLDSRRDGCVWGDPFPAVFRPETVNFIPELAGSVHHSSYAELTFLYFDKSHLQPHEAKAIQPVCSIFLDRRTGCETHLREISAEDAVARLRQSVLFEEDAHFEPQILSAVRALAGNPAYELRYDSDPQIAATFIRSMLQ